MEWFNLPSGGCVVRPKRSVARLGNSQLEFWRGLVLVEFGLPLVPRERGENAGDGSPFCDAETRFCESSDTTNDDDGEHETGGTEEPATDDWRGQYGSSLGTAVGCNRRRPPRPEREFLCRGADASTQPEQHRRPSFYGNQCSQRFFVVVSSASSPDEHSPRHHQGRESCPKAKQPSTPNSPTSSHHHSSWSKMFQVSRLHLITHPSPKTSTGGCGAFYAITIASKAFTGLSTVKQHRLVTEVLKKEIQDIHGLQASPNTLGGRPLLCPGAFIVTIPHRLLAIFLLQIKTIPE